jgi:phosphatidylserine/phosphatidylglycerophosphate/cardiolipin synthase-like enzyme
MGDAPARAAMRRLSTLFTLALTAALPISLIGCAIDDIEEDEEDLGDIGDGKSDTFGVVDKQLSIDPGRYRRVTFTAGAAFRIAVTQPTTAEADRSPLTLSLKKPDATRATVDAANEPTFVLEDGMDGRFSLTIKNVGTRPVKALLNVRPLGGFDGLPNPNAAIFPELAWQPPAIARWPASYVIFNNTGCGHDCAQTDQSALAPRSVMIKMLVAAIKNVKQGGVIRVSNFNISSSNSAKPVVDALVWAMQNRGATVKVVMDQAQNTPTSRTTQLAQQGAQVRFLNGMTYTNSLNVQSVGIMHSKIVAVDDEVVFSGSNNFSSSGFVTNEENSVVLRGATQLDRIESFQCNVDVMFDAGVLPGEPQKTDAQREAIVRRLDDCNGPDTWFPPSGVIATGSSITYTRVASAIRDAKKSVDLAPDMMAHPGLVSTLISRAKKAKMLNQPFAIRLVLDASEEALHNPAFGECLTEAAAQHGLDVQIRYWPGNGMIFQLMHHKFMLIDAEDPAGATLYNGSANYSAKALKWSFENVTRYGGAQYRQLVDAFTARFAQLYAQGQDKARLAAEDGIDAPDCPLDIDTL